MKLLSPAKINLFLHITGRRGDGYHTLQTLFQLLNYGDLLQFSARADKAIDVHCPGLDLAMEQNLVYRAARALQVYAGCSRGARIEVEKHLPAGGGLGGGSSNAATTLLALNQLWELGLDTRELAQLGLSLGADVPVFVHGNSAWAEGVGDQLQAVELDKGWYLVIAPDCAVSTAEVFSREELTRNTSPIKMATFFAQGCRNDCEPVVRKMYPAIDKALIWLENFSPARLTGTGACVFAGFASESQAREVLQKLPAKWKGFVAQGINRSPVFAGLEQ